VTRIINIFGGPGIGKTATAWSFAGYLKMKEFRVEFAPEYAKELAYRANSKEDFDNQISLFAEQNRRIYSLLNKDLDYVITDCPILQCYPYLSVSHYLFSHNRFEWEQHFTWLILKTFNMYKNINFLMIRDSNKKYHKQGRVQTKDEAIVIDGQTEEMLDKFQVPYYSIKSFEDMIRLGNWSP
jgi:hypothetical protein